MNTYTKTLTKKEIQELLNQFPQAPKRFDIPYTIAQIKLEDVTITIYESGKVVYQSKDSLDYLKPSPTSIVLPMSGSDEVGTGSYFGPITVCAAYLDENSIKNIPVSKIQDSKQLKDSDIKEIAPILEKNIIYSLLILDNTKYNEINKTLNMNEIKARLHNAAFIQLNEKVTLTDNNIVDQFVQESTYYRYLKYEPNVFKNLKFYTKAESQYLAVACASIIARNAFLNVLEQLSNHYKMDIPSGAGANIDAVGKSFIKKYGAEQLHHIAKLNFANTQRIMNESK